jgi:pyruvate dehydrogenase E1 component beta subunit
MLGAQHSQAFESFYSHFPGLKVVCFSNAADAKGLLKTAIRDPDPVIFLESEYNYGQIDPVPEETYYIPLGKADVKREGSDLTIIAWQKMVKLAYELADKVEEEFGVSCEIVDPRSIKPLDEETIFASVKKTNRVLILEEGHFFCGVGAEISDRIQRKCFDYLDAPVERVTSLDVPMPYAKQLERFVLPNIPRCIDHVKKVCYL